MTEPYEVSVSSAIRSLDAERVKTLLLARPDLARRLDPNLVFAPGGGNPPSTRVDTALPTIPDHVRPGDLIEADDWNAVLDVLTRIAQVLANLADGAVALSGRTTMLERKLAAVPVPPQSQPNPRDYLRRLLLDTDVSTAIASNEDLMQQILASHEVVQVLRDDPSKIERSIVDPVFDPGPDTFATPETERTASELTREELLKSPVYRTFLAKQPQIATSLGVTSAALKAKGGANIVKPGVAKPIDKPGGGG
jgi:hypothetical protein